MKRNRILAACVGLPVALVYLSASCNVPNYGLEDFDYNDIILLRVDGVGTRTPSACFFGTHDYKNGGKTVWVHVGETVGNRRGKITEIQNDKVRITEMQSLNYGDFVEYNFSWPVERREEGKKYLHTCDETKETSKSS